MHYLYGTKQAGSRRLVATFGSEQQLLAYVRWATLNQQGDEFKFEQGCVLAGSSNWESSTKPLTDEDPTNVDFNPSPAML